ncbi:EcsC family protein [Alkanindiges sp. WGS2144]|uniref:EcsC family protein n=1 Tax=Alkanindiges sp. WGS2144 TaxID=3366808 RepID=UPI003753243D
MTDAVDSLQTKQEAPTDATAHDLLDSLRTGSKSLSDFGQKLLKQLAKNSVSRLTQLPEQHSVINMNIDTQIANPNNSLTGNAGQLFRQQLPGVTRKLLGKRFNTVNKVATLVMPAGSFDKVSDQVLELLADFASTLSDKNQVLEEAGVSSLEELQGDTGRSGRLARALGEKNRYIAMAQGAVSGATGIVGAAADIPLSMVLVFRTVYLTGRAYGFELNRPEDRHLIFKALADIDLSLIAEKQAILLGLGSLSTMLGTGNLQGLQGLLGSNNDIDPLLKLISDPNGQLKWRISPTIINKLTPLLGGAVGVLYNGRLLKDVSESAKKVFEQARQQGVGQTNTQSAAIEDKIINPETPDSKEEQQAQQEAQQAVINNDEIAKVEITSRSEHNSQPQDAAAQDAQIHDQLATLADEMIDDKAGENQQEDKKDSAPAKKTTKATSTKATRGRAEGKTDNTAQSVDAAKPARRNSKKAAGAAEDTQAGTNSQNTGGNSNINK